MVQATDVIVAGSGIAGLTAALAAREQGLSVLVVEKTDLIGGTSCRSEAMVWVPCSGQARSAGQADSLDEADLYLRGCTGNAYRRELVQAYLAAAPEALAFVERRTAARYELATGSCDYLSDLPGATSGKRALSPGEFDGRALGPLFNRLRTPLPTTQLFGTIGVSSRDLPHFFRLTRSPASVAVVAGILARYARDRLAGYKRSTRLFGGHGVVAALVQALAETGVEIRTGTAVSRLMLDRSGRIAGASLAGQDVAASRGVILAGGGFAQSPDLTRATMPHRAQGQQQVSLTAPGNAGDTVRLGLEAGGVLRTDLLQPVAWTPVSLVPVRGERVGYPHFIDRQKPGMIAVDRRGRRFTNEADSYHQFVPAMLRATEGDSDAVVYLVCDHRALRRYGLGVVPPAPGRIGPHLRSGYLASGETPEQLASALGIDPAGLARTIAAFNGPAAQGEDPEFGKGRSAYNRSMGDPGHRPNPCVGPLDQPPFYAVRLHAGDLGTFAGLMTDGEARVLRQDGSVIDGLYAVGLDMASAFSGTYPGAGISVGSAITFGWLAGRHAAAAAGRADAA